MEVKNSIKSLTFQLLFILRLRDYFTIGPYWMFYGLVITCLPLFAEKYCLFSANQLWSTFSVQPW